MQTRLLWTLVIGLSTLLVVAGIAGAVPRQQEDPPAVAAMLAQDSFRPGAQIATQAAVTDTVTYQGRLTDAAGEALSGVYPMRFVLYDAPVAGSAVWDSGVISVEVDGGLFNVGLDVNHADFDGQALWLDMAVDGETLSPRQELLPAPYALSLKPGAAVAGEPPVASAAVFSATLQGTWPAGKAIYGYAPATGTAIHAQASGGQGIYAYSDDTYGVWGASQNSWGGYFASDNGYGMRASSSGDDHWDHAAYLQANNGYGVYATSNNNMAIRGESGDMTGLWQPVGKVGVVGIGESRGVYGSAQSSYGVYATSLNWYGVYGRTSRSDDNYGLYTPDNLFAKNVTAAGSMMSVARNSGDEPLEPGDVVVFTGVDRSPQRAGQTGLEAVLAVAKSTTGDSQAVAGVVYGPYVLVDERTGEPLPGQPIASAGPVAPGEYVQIVVHGLTQVKVDAADGDLQPGDLLATSATRGHATRAAEIQTQDGHASVLSGTTLGKALEPLPARSKGTIYVFVTLR